MIRSLIEKFSSFGTIISAMGCANCFPALAALGASFGLGFLSSYEGLFVNKLLPIFASIVLVVHLINWFFHRKHMRGLLAISGPSIVLLTLYPLWKYGWSTTLFYIGLILMFLVAVYDLISPINKTCAIESI